MSDVYNVLNDIIESKLLELHTAFLAKVVAVDGKKYSIKPLAKYKQYGKEAQEYPVITNVYSCKTYSNGEIGDIVLCVALERDMTNLISGKTNLPFTGVHHRINDAIIIGVVDL